jgi:hypothetical protein
VGENLMFLAMKVEVDLPDRLYEEIRELCEYNNQTIDRYIVDCISDTYYTLKYGDLNLKINKGKEDLKTDEKIVEKTEKKPDVEKKKVGRPRKKVEEIVKTDKEEKPINEEIVLNNAKDTILKKEDTVNIVDEQLQNKIKRTKRTLKVK